VRNWKMRVALATAIFIATVGIYLACRWWLVEPISTAEWQTVPVRKGPLVVTVRAIGAVTSPPEVALNFGIGGRLKELKVAEGDVVRAGDVLAQLDTTDLELRVAQAEAALALSQAQLARTKAGATESELASAKASLAAAQANYEQLKAGPLPADLAAAEAALKSAESSYKQLLAGPNKDEVTIAKANLEKAKIALQKAQAEYDKFAWQQGFEASPQAAALQQATVDYQQALASYNLAMTGPTSDELDKAQAQIAQARAQLEKLRASPTSAELKSAAAQVARAQAEVDRLLNSPTPEELAIAQAQVRQAQIALEQARRQLSYATLVAPISGTVVAVEARVGQSVSAATPIITLADLTHLQVKAGVNEIDIGRVQEGQKAIIHLDALPGRELAGRVSEIAPLPIVTAGVVNYPVTIELAPSNASVRPGMTAQVEIITSQKADALLVPREALRMRDGKWVVRVLRHGSPVEVEIEIGQRKDRVVEVLKGLAEGEEVVIGTISPSAE